MAFPLPKSSIFSNVRSHFQKEEPHNILRRGYHIELGAREKALLEEDPALKRFKSYKKTVKQASKIGNVLTILAVAAGTQLSYPNKTKNNFRQQLLLSTTAQPGQTNPELFVIQLDGSQDVSACSYEILAVAVSK